MSASILVAVKFAQLTDSPLNLKQARRLASLVNLDQGSQSR